MIQSQSPKIFAKSNLMNLGSEIKKRTHLITVKWVPIVI